MIRSQTRAIADALRLGSFQPAAVQREFQWTSAQTSQLLDDLLSCFRRLGGDPDPSHEAAEAPEEGDGNFESTGEAINGARLKGTRVQRPALPPPDCYFLGSVVLHAAPRAKERYYIYDGFQRFTTLALLVVVLRDTWRAPQPADLKMIADLMSSGDNPRLQAPTSGGTLASILNRERGVPAQLRSRGLSDGDRRMREAHKLFEDRIAPWSDERRRAFLDFLSNKVMLSVTQVDNRSLAYQIFVSSNARGLRLGVGDILKGQLVERISQMKSSTAAEAVAKQFRDVQKKVRPKFDEFLEAVEMLKCRPAGTSAPGELLIELFGETADPDDVVDWVTSEFTDLADIYLQFRRHFWEQESKGIDIAFRQLSFLGWKDWQPMALALGLVAPHRNLGSQIKPVQNLQRACYIMELARWDPARRRDAFYKAMDQLENGLDPFASRVRGGDFGALTFSRREKEKARSALREHLADEERRGTIVRWIETLYWGAAVPKHCTDDASVEHVLPRTPRGSWLTSFTEEELEYWTNRLGNLCIIPKEVNDDVGNSDWSVKVAAYRALGGRFRGAEEVAANSDWNAKVLSQRMEHVVAMAERALRIQETATTRQRPHPAFPPAHP